MIAAQEIATPLSQAHRRALARAVHALENPNFAARLADYAGASVNRVARAAAREQGPLQGCRGRDAEMPQDRDRLS